MWFLPSHSSLTSSLITFPEVPYEIRDKFILCIAKVRKQDTKCSPPPPNIMAYTSDKRKKIITPTPHKIVFPTTPPSSTLSLLSRRSP